VLNGEFVNNIDDKGRIMIPAKLRAAMGGDTIRLCRGLGKCLWLFPVEEWNRLSQETMSKTSAFDPNARMMQRKIITAHEIEIDKAGRIIIPPALRDFAELRKECVILAIKNTIEIWSHEAYQKYWEENEPNFNDAAKEFGKLVSL
jgi:MraZ protein